MAWWNRRKTEISELRTQLEEMRVIGGFPWVENNPLIPFGSGGPAHPSQMQVGAEQALRLAPLYGAVRLLADGVASLPLQVYRKGPDGQPVKWTGPTIFNSGPVLEHGGPGPSVTGTLYDWLHQCMTSLALEGNAFGFIAARDGYGYPTTIEWMSPEDVWIDEPEYEGIPNPLRAKYYFQGRNIPREDMFHVRAFTMPGRVRGISPMAAFAILVTQGQQMVKYGNDWFESGGFPPGVMQAQTMEIDPDQSDEIKSRVVAAIRKRQPLVLGADWTYTPIRVPPSEAQFVDAVRLNASQIAAVYGVPAWRVGGETGNTMTYSNQEMETIAFITDTLRPWLVRLETAFFNILPGDRYCRFNADAMIKTDVKTRHEIHYLDRRMGLTTVDQIRAVEDQEPLGGDIGKDRMPLDVMINLVRSGKAVPASLDEEITVINVPAAATPSQPATETTQTPAATEDLTAGPTGPQGTGVKIPPPAKQVTGEPGNEPPRGQRTPAKAPAPRGEYVASVEDVARTWAGARAADPAVMRYCLSETGMAARRHGIGFTGYTHVSMTAEQRDWLLGFVRAQEPPPHGTLPASNGHNGGKGRTLTEK